MSKTITRHLRLENLPGRRSSIHTLSESNFVQVRPRSYSIGTVGYGSTLPRKNQNYSYESGYNGYDSPVMVITGQSPSVLECAEKEIGKKIRYTKKFVLAIVFLIIAAIGVSGLILSKALPKSNAYCLGKHFCLPTRSQISKDFVHPIQSKTETESRKIDERRIPKTIPKVVGKLEVLEVEKNEKKNFSSSDRFIEKFRELDRMKKSGSRFMRSENDSKNRAQHTREWEDLWDNRPIVAPPGVNPRIYLRYDL